jgi:Protein of unknown function (DUF2490)
MKSSVCQSIANVQARCGRSRVALFGLAIALLLPARLSSLADETQQWDELKLVGKCTNKVDIFAATTLRLAEVDPVLNRVSGQLGLNLRPTAWLTLSPNYQYIANDPAEATSNHENRPGIVTAIDLPIGSGEVTLSAGLEYRIREGGPDTWRLRPKLKLKHPLGPRDWSVTGYLANELFFDSGENGIARDRFFVGVEKNLGESWSADFYYCRQHDLRSREPDLNIFGISMTLRFDLRRK